MSFLDSKKIIDETFEKIRNNEIFSEISFEKDIFTFESTKINTIEFSLIVRINSVCNLKCIFVL